MSTSLGRRAPLATQERGSADAEGRSLAEKGLRLGGIQTSFRKLQNDQ